MQCKCQPLVYIDVSAVAIKLAARLHCLVFLPGCFGLQCVDAVCSTKRHQSSCKMHACTHAVFGLLVHDDV